MQPTVGAAGGGVLGFVFAAYPALVAQYVELLEEVGVVDFAAAGFVPSGVVGQLNVADAGQAVAQGVGQFALGALGVVDVELQAQVVGPDFVHQGQCLRDAVQVVAGHVKGVERFNQQLQAQAAGFGGGVAQVVDVGLAGHVSGGARGQHTGHAVPALHAQHGGVGGGLGDAGAEVGLAPRQAGQAPFASGPVAGGQVVQHQLQLVLLQLVGNVVRAVVVGEEAFHRLKTGAGGSGKAV